MRLILKNLIPISDLLGEPEVYTEQGNVPLSALIVQTEIFESGRELSRYTEYYCDGELVKRSVHVCLKPQGKGIPPCFIPLNSESKLVEEEEDG